MENVKDFLLKILKKGVQISLNETEDRIRVVGNTGSLTEEDKTNITHYKEDLIKLLRLNSRQDKNAMVEIPKIQDSTSYEISDAQRRLWILSQFEDGLLAYNMPNEVYLNHEIDLNHFQLNLHTVK